MRRCSVACMVLLSCFVRTTLSGDETASTQDLMPYHLDERFEREFEDENMQALLRTRRRIVGTLNKTQYAVVMVSTATALSYSVHTIPIWKAYCEKHGYDFFLQEESLIENTRPEWTKPRLLMELITKAPWKYIWLVDPESLPVKLEKGFQYAIKEHMRKQRYSNDKQRDRFLWCPEDCERDYDPGSGDDGACYGPQVSGCIHWVKQSSLPFYFSWYKKMKDLSEDPRGTKLALKSLRLGQFFESILYSYVGNEFGFPDSTFLATHEWDETLGYNMRDMVLRTIGKHKAMGDILNKRGEHKPEL